ncbi:alcohol dehydrogenase [Collibacillus ludicampi]|uniref:Alcohol dehydrogenase n=1 Tax=Collibacillus ludicampi TaxID=2771369 RepID=A0AAV4LCM1_9BACL|nr:zinc-binding dehydrogenase [Collibacillus ludicampi]GIM45424.1 alcohol dehydrogenase [Collibacillus ludicampi]
MKAMVLDRPGSPETLRMADLPKPEPGPGEIRVRVLAVGLNPVDYKLAADGYLGWNYPFVLGLDVAGIVDALGEGVTEWSVGDRVFYHGDLSKPGGYAEYAITTAHTAARIPNGVSFTEAAALPCAGMTAYQALHRKAHIHAGETVLIQAGAGGVGGFAVQLANRSGARVITTCSARNRDYVLRLGAEEAIDYNAENMTERVMELTEGRGVDVVVDTVSGQSATAGLEMLAFNGRLVCIAGFPDFSKIRPFSKAVSIQEVALGAAHLSGDRVAQEDLRTMNQELAELVRTKQISPMLEQVIPFEKIPDGLAQLAQRHVRGKIVAEIR